MQRPVELQAAQHEADRDAVAGFPDFSKRLRWFARYRPELLHGLGEVAERGVDGRVRVSLVDKDKQIQALTNAAKHAAAAHLQLDLSFEAGRVRLALESLEMLKRVS